jgi:hypothetical protein
MEYPMSEQCEKAANGIKAEWEKDPFAACTDVPVDLNDPVHHPAHYTNHPSGVECITITEHMGFCLGNAVKYIWRADLKGDSIQDLEKAAFYINRELQKRRSAK